MNNVTESSLNNLFDSFQSERTKILLDMKNDTDMIHIKQNEKKLQCLEHLIKGVLKYRNLIKIVSV